MLSGAAVLLAPVSTVPAQLAHAAGTNTVVTIGFDDSNADQFKMLKMLAAHGMNATFFTNCNWALRSSRSRRKYSSGRVMRQRANIATEM
jgi:peptidoglycan/xylan/chitin deacetylase (PgdA/CDA1 family)